MLSDYCARCDLLKEAVEALEQAAADKPVQEDPLEAARYMRDRVLPAMHDLRRIADDLEQMTDRNLWPFPTYDQLLFSV